MRVLGWQRKLSEYVIEAQARYKKDGFAWGKFDCCTFAADWVKVCTREDVLSEYRGAYSTEVEAVALLESKAGSVYQELVARFGEPVHPAKAQRGDIALAQLVPGLPCVGVFFTSGAKMRGLFLGEGGFILHRLKDINHCFRVG